MFLEKYRVYTPGLRSICSSLIHIYPFDALSNLWSCCYNTYSCCTSSYSPACLCLAHTAPSPALSHHPNFRPSSVSTPSAPTPLLPPDPPPPPPVPNNPIPSPPLLFQQSASSFSSIPPSSSSLPPDIPSVLPWTSLFKQLPRNAGKYSPVQLNPSFDDGAMVPPSSVIAAGELVWKDYLVGFFLDKPLSYTHVIEFLKRKWRLRGNIQVKSDRNIFLFLFSDVNEKDRILRSEPIIMRNKLFIIKQWDPSISNVCGTIRAVPIWVKFTNIPIYSWSPMGINWLANRLGKLVCLDEATETLQRIQFAKCLIEISPNQELVDSFSVLNPDGSKQIIYVSYLWKPDICSHCKVFGHTLMNCDSVVKQAEKETEKEMVGNKSNKLGYENDTKQTKAPQKKVWKVIDRSRGRKLVENIEKNKSELSLKEKVTEKLQDSDANKQMGSRSSIAKKGKKTLLNYFSVLGSINEDDTNMSMGCIGSKNKEGDDIVNLNIEGAHKKTSDGIIDEVGGNNNAYVKESTSEENALTPEKIRDESIGLTNSIDKNTYVAAKLNGSGNMINCNQSVSGALSHPDAHQIDALPGSLDDISTKFLSSSSNPEVVIIISNPIHKVSTSTLPRLLPSPHKQLLSLSAQSPVTVRECSDRTSLSPSGSNLLSIGSLNIFSSPLDISKQVTKDVLRTASDDTNPLLSSFQLPSTKKKKKPSICLGNSKDRHKKRVLRGSMKSSTLSPIDSENDDMADYYPDNTPTTSNGRTTRMKKKH